MSVTPDIQDSSLFASVSILYLYNCVYWLIVCVCLKLCVYIWKCTSVCLRLCVYLKFSSCPGMSWFTASLELLKDTNVRAHWHSHVYVHAYTEERYSNMDQEGLWWSINVTVGAINRAYTYTHMHVYTHSVPLCVECLQLVTDRWLCSVNVLHDFPPSAKNSVNPCSLSLSLFLTVPLLLLSFLLFSILFPPFCLHLFLSFLIILME